MPWRANIENDYGSTEVHHFTIPQTDIVLVAFYPGGGIIQVKKSLDGGNTWGSAVTIDSTAGDNDVMLNEPWAYDPVTGRAGICYGRNIDAGGSKAVLAFRYSDDANSTSTTVTTWSAEHVIDDGTTHSTLDSFYRVGLWMYNGRLSIHYTYEESGVFVTDGLWRCLASYSAGGSISWGSPATVYTGTVIMAVEPNCHGFSDGTVIVSWYDPGVQSNISGDLWISRSLDFGATWDSSATKVTTSTDYGRPRIKGDNGNWWLIANKPWDKETSSIYADVYTLKSTDNGVTWGTPTQQFTHTGTKSLSHPDVQVLGNFVGLLVNDTNGGHLFKYSNDYGSTFSSNTNPYSDSSNSDAPRLLISKNYLIATGYDQNSGLSMYTMNPDFFSILPQDQTSVIDNFNRANENPVSDSGKWTQGSVIVGSTGNALKLVSNAVHRQSAAGTFDRSASYRNDATYTGNIEIWATISAIGGETDLGLGNPSTKNGYYIGSFDSDFYTANGLVLLRNDAGTGSTFYGSGTDGGAQAGDKIALQIIGTEVIVWQNRGGTWAEKYRVNDNTYRASLRASIDIAGNTNAGDTVDDFGGGTVTVPFNSVTPALSGTAAIGNILTCDGGTWTKCPSRQLTYQWQSSPDGSTWSNISNATLSKYSVAAGDNGKELRCVVTGYNPVGTTTANSSASSFVGGGTVIELIGAVPI